MTELDDTRKSLRRQDAERDAERPSGSSEGFDPVEEASQESFPASDAPAWISAAPKPERKKTQKA